MADITQTQGSNSPFSNTPNLTFSSPGLQLNGQNVGGSINFSYAVPTPQDISTFVNQAAGLTANAFATDMSFFNNTQTQQIQQQQYISNNTLSSLQLIAATTQSANNAAQADTAATLNATGGSMSFITTATCETLFDKEKAWEKIHKLEKWRDEVLKKNEITAKLVKKYEAVAPALVKRVSKRDDAKKIWKRTYSFFINPIIMQLDRGEECDMDYVLQTYKLCVNYIKASIRKP